MPAQTSHEFDTRILKENGEIENRKSYEHLQSSKITNGKTESNGVQNQKKTWLTDHLRILDKMWQGCGMSLTFSNVYKK